MGLKDGQLRILPPRKDGQFYGYREHYKPQPLKECNLPNKVNQWHYSIWHEVKKEWQTLMCGEQTHKGLEQLHTIFEQHYPFKRAVLVMTADGNIEMRPHDSF